MRYFVIVLASASLLLVSLGCSQDQGIEVTASDAAKLQQQQIKDSEKQIEDIKKNPNMPEAQKQRAIANIQAGAARSAAGAQAGQAQGSGKK
jgi:hypothetical protein